MSREEIKIQLKELMISTWELSIESVELKDDENNLEKYGINSIDVLELLVRIEDTFSIEIDDSDISAELVESITNLTEYIYVHQSN